MRTDDETVFDLSDPKLWVPVYLPLTRSNKRRKILYGSRDSAKSHFIAQMVIMRMLREQFLGLMVRKAYNSIKESQWATIKSIVEDWGLDDVFEFNVSPLQVKCIETGARLIGKGMDKPGKAKSVKDVSLVWYEEADELMEDDFIQTTLSIRGHDPEEWFSFNSPYMEHWILPRFFPSNPDGTPDLSFERPDGLHTVVPSVDPRADILHTCYLHNPYCDADRRVEYDVLKDKLPEQYRTSGLGLVGRRNIGSLWLKQFNRAIHMRKVEIDPGMSYHLTFDQNNLPYATLLVVQVIPVGNNINEVRIVREICSKPPKNTTEHACDEFIYDYGHLNPSVYIYGDPTGGNRAPRKTKNEALTHYHAIVTSLRNYLAVGYMRVGKHPPAIAGRQRFMERVLAEGTNLRIVIDPSCKNTIGDFEHLVEDTNGGFVKKIVKDKETDQQWEERGHCFTGDTLIATSEGDRRIDEIEPGDKVLTRFGYRKVLKRFDNGIRPVHLVTIGGVSVECTRDHKFFTLNRGFIPISDIKEGDIAVILDTWKSTIKDENSSDTQDPKSSLIECTSGDVFGSMGNSLKPYSIGTCGNARSARSRMDSRFTTRTGTRTITTFQTSNLSEHPTTDPYTPSLIGPIQSSRRKCNPTLPACMNTLHHGTSPRKGVNGTGTTERHHGSGRSLEPIDAITAQVSTRASKNPGRASAPICAGGGIEIQDLNQWSENVRSAGKCLGFIPLSKRDAARLRVALEAGEEKEVYDLHVESDHEYFANGVLVHNCMDAFVNFMSQAFPDLYRYIARA